jgi:hypothetical protein
MLHKEGSRVPKVLEHLNVGNRDNMTLQELLLIVEKMYQDLAINLNKKADIIQQTTDGLSTDTFLDNGTLHINSSTNKVEMLTNHNSATTVQWVTLS